MDIIAYTYITINPFNGKLYIGFHKHNGFDPYYKGSGNLIRRAFEKYGWDNFKCYMIKAFDDLQEAYDHERYLIEKYHAAEDPKFYNLQSGHRYRNAYYRVKNDEGNEILVNIEEAPKYFKKNGYIKRNYTIRDLVWVNDGENNYLVSPDELDDYLNNRGYTKGMTEAHNEKSGATIRGKVAMHYEDQEGFFYALPEDVESLEKDGAVKGKGPLINGRVRINNGIEEILIYPEELDDPKYNGWVRGNIVGRHTYNHVCATKGKKVMHWEGTDGSEKYFYVSSNEVSEYISLGAILGYGPKGPNARNYYDDKVSINNGKVTIEVSPDEVSELLSKGYELGALRRRYFITRYDQIVEIPRSKVVEYKRQGYDINFEIVNDL